VSRRGWTSLALAETAVQTRLLSRNVVSAFFTLAMPLVLLVVVNLFLGGQELSDGSPASIYFTPAIAVFALVTATFTNLAIGTAIARDSGVLKRVYGSPMPLSAYLAGRILSATLIGLASVLIMLALGVVAYGVVIPWPRMPMFLSILLVGAAAFSALGIAVSMLTPSARAAPAVANAVILPLLLVSGIFFPLADAPGWLQTMARLLPLGPFVEVAVDQFVPSLVEGAPWGRIGTIALWGAAGLAVAIRFFRWEPRGETRTRTQSFVEIDT
jgi:ABC-2 type transport system permease protein